VLAGFAIKFSAAEYFSLIVLGLVASIVLAHGSLLHAIGMIFVGLALGLIGGDVNSGVYRYTFDFPELNDGIGFVVVAMGLFGIAEVVSNLAQKTDRTIMVERVTGLIPSREKFKEMLAPILRGTALGSALGLLPGGGATLSSFAAYSLEKKMSKRPEEFGKGALAGVAGPESANNAGAQTSFIPMLTLGIPGNPVMALMIGALIVHGIQPGASMIAEQPKLFWGVVASMWIGNVMLLVLNLPMIGMWVRLASMPYNYLYPAILVFCGIGVFSLANTTFDIYLMAIFGILGYLLRKIDCEPAPLLLGFILGPMLEEYLRRALLISGGDATVLVTRPISAIMLVIAAFLLFTVLSPHLRKKREEVFQEDRAV
jgi:putative tricarboxylic transport membrane protein